MKSEEEIRKTFKLFLDENGILNLSIFNESSDKEETILAAQLIKNEVENILNQSTPKSTNILLDLTPLKIVKVPPSAKAREIYIKLSSDARINKIAIIGASYFHVSIAKSIFTIARKKKVNAFSDRKEASDWLREE
ncbi:MAG: hypothetical protein COY66_01750 [Candidatus Kerfeldbacteria bacterium CG_4_10_14_0_8_um_filter_42_10]|uniref:STAS/SEC14 domain-containing protein n=1 Tax=Candidatus Kerfeldbacteria bacterium CG_4_10_14_0_8_um_filter_42_10 TaxID=2014248 RepID=A0A2M7RKP9_9BACT|nr:MAG: hypothetical protein COY66_01750 [Candidatus Kerfeldbacteria bacterium CG_4_10_14_0_8_um_filter_42_10]